MVIISEVLRRKYSCQELRVRTIEFRRTAMRKAEACVVCSPRKRLMMVSADGLCSMPKSGHSCPTSDSHDRADHVRMDGY